MAETLWDSLNNQKFLADRAYKDENGDNIVSTYAKKSEMSVTPGTGADADKTTIELKNGLSATVLTAHQSITGKADKVDVDQEFTETSAWVNDSFYPLTSNPAGYLVQSDLDDYATTGDLTDLGDALKADIDFVSAAVPASANNGTLTINIGTTGTATFMADQSTDTTATILMASFTANPGTSTTAYTEGLMSGEDKEKLSQIAPGAQVNVQSDWEESNTASDAYIKNKPEELDIAAGEGIGITEANNTLTISVSANYATDDDINFLSGAIDDKVETTAFNDALDEINDTFEEIDENIDFLSGAITGIPAQVQSNWMEDDNTSPAYIQNKPAEISLSAGEGIGIVESNNNIVVSVTGDYADASEIGSEISFLSGAIDDKVETTAFNDALEEINDTFEDIGDNIEFLSGAITGIPAQVQSDWAEYDTTDPAYIKNKPDELSLSAGEGIGIAESGNDIVISVTGNYADAASVASDISFLSGAVDSKLDITAFNDTMSDLRDELDEVDYDIDYLSAAVSSIPAQVQADWAEDDSTDPAYIKNKPTELSLAAGEGIGITETTGNIEISVSADYALSADVDTRLADKLDTTAAAQTYYPLTNPSSYEENVITAVQIGGTAMTVTNKAVNFDMIPTTADSNNPLVTTADMAAAIADFGGFKVVQADQQGNPDESNPDTRTVYLVKNTAVTGDDKYKEWIWKAPDTTATPPTTSAWELIGDTSMDLNGYVQFPANYTAGNLVTFGTNSIVDSNYTTADVVNVQANWNESVSTSHAYILNKPTFTGSTYIDITTGANNQLTIDANINAISGAMADYANVQSDWSEADSASDAYIANKPDVLIPQVGAGVTAIPKYVMVVTAMPAAAQIDPNTIYLVQGTYIGT